MDFKSSISFPNEPLISWTFLGHFVITFVWMQQQTNSKPTKNDEKNGQEMFNWSEVHSEKKYFL
jgi:hypothetical protein